VNGLRDYHVLVKEEDGGYWGEVIELPGCFASGHDFEEFKDALLEAIKMCAPEESREMGTALSRARLGAMVLQT
jgi:predicted RNase H-like HicB family nuclease